MLFRMAVATDNEDEERGREFKRSSRLAALSLMSSEKGGSEGLLISSLSLG